MKTSVEDTYKHLLKKSKIEPPGQIWDSISQNLDIDNVWTNISRDLELQTVLRFENFAIVTSAVAIYFAIFFISFPPRNQISTYSKQPLIDSEVTTTIDVEDKRIMDNSDDELTEVVDTGEFRKSPVGSSNSQTVKYFIRDPLNESNAIKSGSQNEVMADLRKSEYLMIIDSPKEPRLIWNLREVSSQSIDYSRKEMFFGLTGSFKNTWILNNKTFSGFSSQELHTTKAIFGREFGIFFGSTLNRRMSIVGEYYFTSNYAQAYNEYLGGHYISSSFNVDYSKINLLFSYNLKPALDSKGKIEFLLGPYMGVLKKAAESLNQNEINLTENYKKQILGLTGGIQKQYHINQNLDLTTGLRLSYGITNIYKGTPIIPASFRITHPAAISITLGLRYSLQRQ